MSPSKTPQSLDDIVTPALLIEEHIMQDNLVRMQQLAAEHRLALRPHIKSHKSIALARRQLAAGAIGIAVAKLSEAEVFARAGFTDIQIANQVVTPEKIRRLADLAERITISCAVDSVTHIRDISAHFASRGLWATLFIEVDSGLHRAGIRGESECLKLAEMTSSSDGARLGGLLTHAGHAYGAAFANELQLVAQHEGHVMADLAATLRLHGFTIPVVSVGSTPTAQIVAGVPGITELRVGNYIFNDLIQVTLGVATQDQCALSVLATVTSVHADRVIIDAGSKTFSSDAGAHGNQLITGYGRVVGTDLLITRLSEEHGIIAVAGENPFQIGDRLRVLPNHACPIMNLASHAYVIDGDRVIESISIDASRAVQ